MKNDLRHLPHDSPEMADAFEVMKAAFAEMEGRIDPPSSISRMSVEDLRDPACEVWVAGDPVVGTVVLTPKAKVLYVGKLAVRDRRTGVGRQLMALAEERAVALGFEWLELESRVELVEVHGVFKRMGFREVGRTTHEGFVRPTAVVFRKGVG